MGGFSLDNPSFSRIFGIVLTWQDPLRTCRQQVAKPFFIAGYVGYYIDSSTPRFLTAISAKKPFLADRQNRKELAQHH